MPADSFDDAPAPIAQNSASEPYFDDAKREALGRALREKFGMSDEDSSEISKVIAQCFGDQAEVNDETLEPTVRSIFYTLEAKKIVSFRREEYQIESGEKRRGFWWRLRPDTLAVLTTEVPVQAEEDVYSMLPKSAWSTRQNA